MKVLTTIKSGDHQALERAIQDGEHDIIFLKPGTYSLLKSIRIHRNLVIKGLGNNPEEVVIHAQYYAEKGVELAFSNLTIKAPHKHNALNLKDGVEAHLDKVIVQGEVSGDYPAIWCEKAKLALFKSEVYSQGSNSSSCYVKEHGQVQIHYSIVDSVKVIQSSLDLYQSQIRYYISGSNNSILKASKLVHCLAKDQSLYQIYLSEGSQLKIDQLIVDHLPVSASLKESHLQVDSLKIKEDLQIEISKDDTSTVEWKDPTDQVIINGVESLVANETESVGQLAETGSDETDEAGEATDPVEEAGGSALDDLHDLFGLEGLKEQVMKFIHTVQFNQARKEEGLTVTPITLHSLFLGNPGTGKTTVARILGRVLYENGVIKENKFIEVTRKDLVAQHIGHTAQKTQAILEESKGGILFIDEAYALYSDSGSDFGKEAVDTLLTFMEDHREDTMIIFAGYTDEMNTFMKMNSGFESRIPNKFYFDDYLPDEIAEIGYKNLVESDYIVDENLYKDTIARLYTFSIDKSNARWVRNINEKLIQAMASRVIETNSSDNQTILAEDFSVLTGNEVIDKEEKIQEILHDLNNLIGLEAVKDYVEGLLKQVEVDQRLYESGTEVEKPTYHMIFSGNPGTGKTTVANMIADLFYYLDVLPSPNVKVVDRSDLVGPYIGHTEKQTKEIIEQAMGGVLFIDEAYQLSAGSENDFGKQAVETLLTYLENYRDKFIVILAGYTNEMEKFLDMNPGLRSRIPLHIEFPDYSPDEVAEIVCKTISKNWEVDEARLSQVVKDIYCHLPASEQANARWARNFSDQLIQRHKVWLSDHDVAVEAYRMIPVEVIEQMKDRYRIHV